jgi:uncharacterized protein YbjT (DUF2867 family)
LKSPLGKLASGQPRACPGWSAEWESLKMKLLLLGATGLVGGKTVQRALSSEVVSLVIAPTRQALASHDRLVNPVGQDLNELVASVMSYKPDAVICALGTTQKKAGSNEAFRRVDYELPIAFAGAAYSAGVATFAIVTAMGASPDSRSFYYRTKGELERDIQKIAFRSLTICRPSLIGGERTEARTAEAAALVLLGFFAPILPEKFRINPADVIAATLLDAVTVAKAGCRRIDSQELN